MEDDEWVASHFPNERYRLHALGLVNVHWNQCENGLFWLFTLVAGLPQDQGWAMVHDLGDIAISNRITTLAEIRPIHSIVKASIANALSVYDLCRQNRNQLTHFHVVQWTDDFQLARKSKSPTSRAGKLFPSGLGDIRRVAEEIIGLEERLWLLAALMGEYDPSKDGPWPPTLPEPELLWKPPPQVRRARQPQP